MSAVGKELAESSAGRNSDSEGFAGEFSKLLIRKEKKDDAAAGDNNKKKLVEGGLSGDSDLCKSGEKLNKEAFGEGGGIIGFDSDLFFRTLEELVERSKKKTDDPPPGDERNHIKAMQLLKEMHEKVKMEKKFLAQEQEKRGGGVNIVKNTTTTNKKKKKKKKDDAAVVPATIGKKPLLLNDLLASRRASAPCPKVPMSKKQKNKASLEEFRRQFGPHRTTLTTARNMFLQDVAWSKDIIHRA